MSLVIANNVSALTAQNNLSKTSTNLARSLERLSSGLKVNRGSDGPAALTISEKQRAQIAGLTQAIDNSEKAVALVQTAEGALSEISSLLTKVRSLAIDSANSGVNDEDALAANQAEITNALETIDRIANNTQFGTKRLLDGSAGITGTANDSDVTFLKATADTAPNNYAVTVTTAGANAAATAGSSQTGNLAADETLTINGVSIALESGLSATDVRNRINEFTTQTGVIAEDNGSGFTRLRTTAYGSDATIAVVSNQAAGATSTGFGTTVLNGTGDDVEGTIGGVAYVGTGNVLTATSGVAEGLSVSFGADTGANADKTVTGAQGNVTVIDNSLTFQIGPNKDQTASIAITQVNPTALGVGVSGNQFASLNDIDVTSSAGAQDALEIIDSAVDDVAVLRGDLGAFQQNTLESTANNLEATLKNTVNAESVIRDTDFAEEISNFTKQQVLIQAGTSALSSANQTSQLVLSLLG